MKTNNEIITETEDEIKEDPIIDINDQIRRGFPIFFIVLATLIIAIPLLSENISTFNEFRIHIVRIISIHKLLFKGIFPVLISPDNMSGFGYALNVFYGPITTYFPIIFSAFAGGNDIFGLKIFTIVVSLLSSLSMYFFTLKITKNRYASTIAAIVYTLAPYKLTDIFSRNAVGEYTAFIFIPMLFNGIYELLYENINKNYLIIIAAVGLILSHTISSLYTAIFTIIFLLIHPKRTFNKKNIGKLAIDLVIILLLSSFYLIPLLEYKGFTDYAIYDETKMGTSVNSVKSTTIGLDELFKNEFKSFDENHEPIIVLSLGIAPVLLTVLSLFVFNEVESKYKKIYISFLIFALFSLFMCTPAFPWIILPKFMGVIQFSWRMLGFFLIFDSFICGINAYLVVKDIRHFTYLFSILIIGITMVLGTARTFKYFGNFDLTHDGMYEESTKEAVLNYNNVNKEYLPLKASNNMKYMLYRPDGIILLDFENNTNVNTNFEQIDEEENLEEVEFDFNIENENKDNLNYSADISGITDRTKFELPYLYYPGYQVSLNGESVEIFESNNGFLSCTLDKDGKIEVKYTGTDIEKVGYIISAFGIIIFIIYLHFERKQNLDYDNMIHDEKALKTAENVV